jgi:hypothetical protein
MDGFPLKSVSGDLTSYFYGTVIFLRTGDDPLRLLQGTLQSGAGREDIQIDNLSRSLSTQIGFSSFFLSHPTNLLIPPQSMNINDSKSSRTRISVTIGWPEKCHGMAGG